MHHNLIIRDGDTTKVVKEVLVDGIQFVDEKPRAGSTNPVTSDGVNKAIGDTKESVDEDVQDLQEQIDDIAEKAGSGYTPKGEASVATLNGLSGQENGWLYTMTDAGTLTNGSLAVAAGDTVAWDEANSVWYKAMDYAPAQYGTNEVHNLPTTITAFRTGDVIPVDGPSGTAKMGKDDLLRVTADNTLGSIHSLSDTATEADLVDGNYFAIDGSAGTKKLAGNLVIGRTEYRTNVNVSFGYTRNNVPNINTTDRTIDLGGDFIIRCGDKARVVSSRSVPILNTNVGTSLQMLLYSFETETFEVKGYSQSIPNKSIVVGMIRYYDNVDYLMYKAYFPFDFTVDGKPSDYYAAKNYEDLVDIKADLHKLRLTESDYDQLLDGYISSSSKLFVSSIYNETYVFRNRGFAKLEVVTGSTNTTPISIAFYRNGQILWNSFDFNNSIDATGAKDVSYSVNIPYDCELICIGQSKNWNTKFKIRLFYKENLDECGQDLKSYNYNETNLYFKTSTPNRLISQFTGATEKFRFVASAASGYKIGLHIADESFATTFETPWQDSIDHSAEFGRYYQVWIKRDDNGDFSDAEKADIGSLFTDFSVTRLADSSRAASVKFAMEYTNDVVNSSVHPKLIRNVSHQGYSKTSWAGHSMVESYINAANAGFDCAECDVQFSGDDVAVCCHDPSFVDQTTSQTIVIADHTVAELKTYNYHGGTIATFEEVVATCKDVGLKLYIDKPMNFLATPSRINQMTSTVKKYGMEDDAVWIVFNWLDYQSILDWYAKSSLAFLYTSHLTDADINFVNGVSDGNNHITIQAGIAYESVADIIDVNSKLKPGVSVEIWTADTLEDYEAYKPYVSAITSNKLSERIIAQGS